MKSLKVKSKVLWIPITKQLIKFAIPSEALKISETNSVPILNASLNLSSSVKIIFPSSLNPIPILYKEEYEMVSNSIFCLLTFDVSRYWKYATD